MIVECSMELQEIMEVFEEFNENLKIARSESVKRKFRRLSAGLKGTFSEYIGKCILWFKKVGCVRNKNRLNWWRLG